LKKCHFDILGDKYYVWEEFEKWKKFEKGEISVLEDNNNLNILGNKNYQEFFERIKNCVYF
jgi:hypothetical protein